MENQGTSAVKFETEGLDEIIKLIDKDDISGKIAITGNDIEGKIYNVKITDKISGNIITVDDFDILEDNKENVIGEINSKEYTVEFNFKRSKGRKGLRVDFGKTDPKNSIFWDFGGWDNWDCNIFSIVNGRGSVISHRIFHVEDMEYTLKLEVSGRNIKTYINGEMWNDTTDRLPELEELYITASVDENSGETILKAVNLTGEEKQVELSIEGDSKTTATVVTLAGYELGDENTFDEPDKIKPVESQLSVNDNKLEYTFAPHSVTVLKFR